MTTTLGPRGHFVPTADDEWQTTPAAGVMIGVLVDIDSSGAALVDHAGNARGPLKAQSLVEVVPTQIGSSVALAFEAGDAAKPIILGVVRASVAPELDVQVDGERVTLTAEKEIVLRCGKASITLTRAGKVLIKGEYVLTHAGGVNRIRGGSVQIN